MFDEIFDTVFSKPYNWTGNIKNTYPMNVVKLVDDNNKTTAYRIEYALAGFAKEDIHITVSNDTLIIEAEHKSSTDKNEIVEYNGISYRKMSMSFVLMDDADKKNIKSKYENGLLKITIPVKTVEQLETSKIVIE